MPSVDDYSKLITSEHADKQKFVATVEASCKPFVGLAAVISTYNSLYDIDNAVGKQLDVVGEWIGISRYLKLPLVGIYFTLDTGPGLDSGILIGDFDLTSGLTALYDDYYRILLYAKILNNHWDGSIDKAYEIGEIAFKSFGYTLFIQDNGNLTMNLGLAGGIAAPSAIVKALLTNHLFDPKPATIHISNYIWQAVPDKIFMLDAPVDSLLFGGLDSGHLPIVTPN